MSLLFLLLLIGLTYLITALILKQNIRDVFRGNISIVILAGFFVSISATFIHGGHPSDMGCFDSWSRMLFSNGLSKFYSSSAFTDYPPGYMYVLYIIGAVRSLFDALSIQYNYVLLLKFPAIMANLITGIFIYSIAIKRTTEKNSIILSLFYILNPMIIFNASVWGQVDSIHTLTIIIAIYYITEEKLLLSSLMFVASAFIKPQALMFAPLYIFIFIINLKEETVGFEVYLLDKNRRFFNWQNFLKAGKPFFSLLFTYMRYFLLCVSLAFFLMLPFADTSNGGFNFMPIIEQYKKTLDSYNHATVNAYNLYGMLGLNWNSAEDVFLGLTLSMWGNIFLVIIVIFSLYLLTRSKTKSNFFYTAAVINICTFMFSVKMHERYSFPILGLLLMAYVYKMDKRILFAFFAATAAILLNCADVFRASLDNYNWKLLSDTGPAFSVITSIVFIYMIVLAFKVYRKGTAVNQNDLFSEPAEPIASPDEAISEKDVPEMDKPEFEIEKSEPKTKMGKRDYVVMFSLVAVYAVIAFANLGNMESPQSPWVSGDTETVIIDFGREYDLTKVHWFLGVQCDKTFTLSSSIDNVNWSEKTEVKTVSVFSWSKVDIGSSARYVKLETDASNLMLMEMGFEDNKGNLIQVVSADAPGLFDEQNFIPVNVPNKVGTNTYMSGTYFDEIYHARTAYEYIHKLDVYENTHPPLGKIIISTGILIFGMTPFGWRFAGTLVGVLMLPLMFLFAKKMFKDTFWAFFATFIFAFDFMHYVQTRIATIDTYITFFVIAMFYYMYKYWRTSFYDTPFRKTLVPLFLSGLCMGLGIACKWPGVYAASGLAAVFFIVIFKRYKEYAYAKKNGMDEIAAKYPKYIIWTLLWCVVFFAIIPAVIYLLSYIPYYATGSLYPARESIPFLQHNSLAAALLPDNAIGNFIASVIQNQINMFNYHSKLVSEHPFSSPWWSWPLIIKPIYYYSHYFSETIRGGISSFGNPAVWWTGLVALGYCVKDFYKKLIYVPAIIAAGVFGKFVFGDFAILMAAIAIIGCCVIELYKRKEFLLIFLIIGFFAQYIFWMPVPRTTYIYHYFPCVPFLALLITYMFKDISQKYALKPAYIYLGVVFLLFVMFYPVLTGIGVYAPYVKNVLKFLLPHWQLIS